MITSNAKPATAKPLTVVWFGCVVAVAMWLFGCGGTGQAEVSFEVRAAGTASDVPIGAEGGWQLTLDEAKLAFGPLVLCPGFQAGALCDVARAEWLDSAVVDVLDPDAEMLGMATGVTGATRSWMYDLGVVSTLTQEQPLISSAAQSLTGHSLVVRGVAKRDGTAVPFEARLLVQQEEDTEIGVPVVRKSSSDLFDHQIDENTTAIVVTFNAASWLADINFDQLLSDDCALGASSPCIIPRDSQAARAIRNALIAGQRPLFHFTGP